MAKKKDNYKNVVDAAYKKMGADLIKFHKAAIFVVAPELNKDIPKPGKGSHH